MQSPRPAVRHEDLSSRKLPRRLHLVSRAKNHIDSGPAGDLRDKIRPTTRKRAASHLDALAQRCDARRLDRSVDTDPYVEHVLRRSPQINVNLESAIFDCPLHETLRFPALPPDGQVNGQDVFLGYHRRARTARLSRGGFSREIHVRQNLMFQFGTGIFQQRDHRSITLAPYHPMVDKRNVRPAARLAGASRGSRTGLRACWRASGAPTLNQRRNAARVSPALSPAERGPFFGLRSRLGLMSSALIK
ncbi:protein of unknown function [Burkholderia multivorans]